MFKKSIFKPKPELLLTMETRDLFMIFQGERTTLQPGDIIEIWHSDKNSPTLNFFRPTSKNETGEIQFERIFLNNLLYQAAPQYIVEIDREKQDIWKLILLLVYVSPDVSKCERPPADYEPQHKSVTDTDCWLLN